MSKNMFLMCKDIPVMEINFDEGIYNVLDEKHLPYQLQGKIKPVMDFSEIKTRYDDTQRRIAINSNYSAITEFLSSRVLPLTRQNAKKIYQLLGFEQLQDTISKSKISIICRAISLQDNYWVKLERDKTQWKDIDLRHNHLNEVIAQVALHGSSLTLNGERMVTPETAGQGAYAKAWKREDGDLWLYKIGSTKDSYESKIEVSVSNILKKCNVNALEYKGAISDGIYACKSKCMTTENKSILSGMDFVSYCNANNINPNKKMMDIDAESIYKMGIVDYLISNSDRHGQNWGFFYDADTMEILGLHPLFDHNNAFDEGLMANKDFPYLFNNQFTMKEFATMAMNRVDFHFIEEILPSDFISPAHYKSFMERAEELGIELDKGKGYDE